MKAYYFLGRLLSPAALVGFLAYSYLTRTNRARVIVRNERGEILLVQTWLGSGKWSLPGGGIEKNERPSQAALRELKEETGIIALERQLEPLFALQSMGHKEEVFLLTASLESLPASLPSKFEVKAARWLSLDQLPPLDSLAARVVEEWRKTDDFAII